MKNKLGSMLRAVHAVFATKTIARFGEARLIKNPDGRIELVGGSRADRASAREWCSLFRHEIVAG